MSDLVGLLTHVKTDLLNLLLSYRREIHIQAHHVCPILQQSFENKQ